MLNSGDLGEMVAEAGAAIENPELDARRRGGSRTKS
jgi:hypothetical protein